MIKTLRLFAVLGALSVAIGAFGAHGLEKMVAEEALVTFRTGVRYQFYHVFALGATGLLYLLPGHRPAWLSRAAWMFGLGILFFCGSLYLLTLRDFHPVPVALLGPITPLGGLFFVFGWVAIFLALPRKSPVHD